MDAYTINSVRTLLANLSRVSLAGVGADACDFRRVANSLALARVLPAGVLEDWSERSESVQMSPVAERAKP